ncbi:MAG: AAA family ATPase, partial [Deltaproteobacteria bacterium]|nr:AAA family ATPase [Deltaproteobacteria bacterium]
MRIKRVFMHGFKSFVDRTEFVLPEGISAIIGPNGCGKSNIVDAIRWVIGEHNPRHLRGRLMEDLIFNGSDARKPLGMAEVSIVLLNTGGVLPAQYSGFSEIEVIRRLYRSGESEYFINKVDARLKDIVELFTDTGVGTRAYSIIEQGQVGWLINAKPEERRTLFEEAAGINKYKGKKDAALRRLDASRENLLRVNDIINEVKRQLNSLNRLAKKAERYKVLKQELKTIELKLSSREYKNGLVLLNETTTALEKLKDEETILLSNIALIQAAIEEQRLEIARKE